MGRQVLYFGQIVLKQIVNPIGKRFALREILYDRFLQSVSILRFQLSLDLFHRHPSVTGHGSSNATERTMFAGFIMHRLHNSLRLPIDGVSPWFSRNSFAGSFCF